MTRAEAIGLLVEEDLLALVKSERASLVLDWWTIDADDSEYLDVPEDLRREMATRGEPDAVGARYDPLLRIALRHRYIGVLNSYLETRLHRTGRNESVSGSIERLRPCRCCRYRTLSDQGWDVCPVCFWEDDGTENLDRVSGANHLTLGQGRENFERFGACSERARSHVLADGRERFEYEGSSRERRFDRRCAGRATSLPPSRCGCIACRMQMVIMVI